MKKYIYLFLIFLSYLSVSAQTADDTTKLTTLKIKQQLDAEDSIYSLAVNSIKSPLYFITNRKIRKIIKRDNIAMKLQTQHDSNIKYINTLFMEGKIPKESRNALLEIESIYFIKKASKLSR